MKLYENIINAEHLLTIFAGKEISLPWRGQSFFRIRVPFREYIRFVKMILPLELCPLTFDKEVYKRQIINYDAGNTGGMTKLYYIDIAQAMLNELQYSIKYGVGCSVICPLFDECTDNVQLSNIDEMFKTVTKEDVNKGRGLLDQEIDFRKVEQHSHNWTVLKGAIGLRALAYSDPNPRKINLV